MATVGWPHRISMPALTGAALPRERQSALDGFASAYLLCILICMRTTLDLDRVLVEKALAETGAKSKTEVIEMGLRLLLEREARKRLKALAGRRPDLEQVRRRR